MTPAKRRAWKEYRLNVQNIDERMNPEQLKALFAPFGAVLEHHVQVDRYGASLGRGYAVLRGERAAQKAIAELNGKFVCGKALAVVPAPPSVL